MYNQLREKAGKQYIWQTSPIPSMNFGDDSFNLAEVQAFANQGPQALQQFRQNYENRWDAVTGEQEDPIMRSLNAAMNTARQAPSQSSPAETVTTSPTTPKYFSESREGKIQQKGWDLAADAAKVIVPQAAEEISGIGTLTQRVADGEFDTKTVGYGVAGAAVSAASQVADDLFMSDKNFGAQSQAIDTAVHGVSGALMKSGNPYAMAVAGAMEGINFLTKAGGQTVQGFDVEINSSGYGELGHMESSSTRSLFGLGNKNLSAKLQKRNQQAMMAMNAANIAEEQTFEQEARMNSIQNTVMNNQIALAGGLETSLLGG